MSCALGAAAAAPAPRASPRAPRVNRDLTRSRATTQGHGGRASCAAGSARGSRVSSAPRVVSGIARRSRVSARRGTRAFAKLDDDFEDAFEGAEELETKGGTAKAERTASDSRAADRSGASPGGAPRPPERDTGIKRERDMGIDFEAEERNEVDAEGEHVLPQERRRRGRRRVPVPLDRAGPHEPRRGLGTPRDALGEGGCVRVQRARRGAERVQRGRGHVVGNVEGGVLTGSIVVFFRHGRWRRDR